MVVVVAIAVVSCDLHNLSRVVASVLVVWEARLQDLQTILVYAVFVVPLMMMPLEQKRTVMMNCFC